jgi:hypothetical protein
MKNRLLILLMLLFVFGCRKDQELFPKEEKPLPSYIKKLLPPDRGVPYTGFYFIEASFKNNTTSETKTLRFNASNTSMSFRYDSSVSGSGVSEYTVMFINSEGKHLEISFCYDLAADTTFRWCCADYLYGDPGTGIPGANVQYAVPCNNDEKKVYIYQGVDSEDSSFKITYLGNGRANGTFHTTWKECSGEETTYDVSGDFSIPLMPGYKVV